MAKTRQVLYLCDCGKKYKVIFDCTTNRNPYRIYELEYGYNKEGRWRESKKLVERYQNMESVLYHLAHVREFKKDVFEIEGESK